MDIIQVQSTHKLLCKMPIKTIPLAEAFERSDNLLLINSKGVYLAVNPFHLL